MNRRFRLLAALGIALVLSTFMIYTALAGGNVKEPVIEAHELTAKRQLAGSRDVELVAVAAGPVTGTRGDAMQFFATDTKTTRKYPVSYRGSVPDAFRVGRNIVVKGRLHGDTFVATPDTLVTKCPSKFQAANGGAGA